MSRVFPRWIDFMGRSTFGRESMFFRDKRLLALGVVLGLAALFSQSMFLWGAYAMLIVAVLVLDLRRYNREHPDG